MSFPRNRPVTGLVSAILAVSLLAACGDKDEVTLVSLGDSYASGEGLSPYTPASDTAENRCHNSADGAYAVIAARALEASVENRSCSGATTKTMVAEQLRDLNDADIVTVTIGGNDIQALSQLANTPDPALLQQRLDSLGPILKDAYAKIREAAGDARVVVVGYPAVVPETAGEQCFIKPAQVPPLRAAQSQLNSTIGAAAASAGFEYVDLSDDFAGHELCSQEPWVNAINFVNFNASLHPNRAGQDAMARAVVDQIRKTP